MLETIKRDNVEIIASLMTLLMFFITGNYQPFVNQIFKSTKVNFDDLFCC